MQKIRAVEIHSSVENHCGNCEMPLEKAKVIRENKQWRLVECNVCHQVNKIVKNGGKEAR